MESLADIRRWLIEFFSASLGINPQELDPAERFKSYGVDSAAALRLTAGIARRLGRPLEQTLLWDCPTVDQLAAYLAHPQPATVPAGPAARAAAGTADDEPIAIIGMACRLPGAADKGAYWQMLTGGEAAITEVPADRWNAAQLFDADFRQPGKMNTRWGGFIGGVDQFEPGFFGISPREAVQMDPQQRIMLELSLHALHDAGIPVETLKGTATGVFFGAVWNDYLLLGKQAGSDSITQHTATGTHHSLIANRVSYTFGFQGPSLAIDTACSSSLVSVHLAVNSLRSGEATLALAGGVNLILSPDSTIAMSKFGAMAPDGRCKAFDASADGYVRGEGAGIVVLKPLAAALADGDRVYCVVAGSAVNNDGMSNGLSAPNPKAQEEVLAAAYRKAGIDPGAVRYLETHGTGTALGDPIEAKSIGKVLCRERSEDRPLFLGAVKTNIGHLEAAAGIAGLIKAALVVSHRLIPANLNFRQPNPNVPFGPYKLAVPLRNEAWPEPGAAIAGVSSFGFGGTNCHVVLREVAVPKPCLAALSAGDSESLRAALAGWLRDGVPAPAAPSAGGRVRFAAAADSRPALEGVVRRFVDGRPAPGMLMGEGDPPPLVFVFSGQGSQWAGMGRELLAREPVFRAALERIDAVFRPLSGWSVADELARAVGGDRGKQIEVVQPLLFSVQVGLAALWEDWGVRPDVVVGHSMGEAAAACVAGMLSLADAVRVIYHRSRLMARLTGQGGMLAVGLESGALTPWLAPYPQLNVAVRNSPSSTVVSGAREALVRLAADLEGQHVFNRLIQVEVASHSPQVASLEAELYAALASIAPRPGRCRMVSTVYGREVACHALDAGYWVRNLAQPVEFLPATLHLLGQADPVFVEVSPHPILQKAIEETAASLGRPALVLPSLAKDETPYGTLAGTVARLYAKGYAPRWPRVGQSITVATGGTSAEAEVAGESLVLVLSAHTPGSLSDLIRDVHRQVQAPDAAYRDLAYTAAVRRTHLPHRVAVVAGSADQLAGALAEHLAGEPAAAVFRGGRPLHYARKIAFVFSGQGAQWQGMAGGLLAREPVFAEAVAACDALLEELGVHEWTLHDKITNPGPGDLQQTEVAQPLIFSIQMGLAALWESWGIRPGAVVGHSVGEVAAACVAGILSLRDALALVCYRGLACRELQGKGAMAAVDLPEARVRELLQALPVQLLEVAAVNSPASTVVAGDPAALRTFLAARAGEGVKCNVISGQYAFHSRQTEAIRPALLRKVRKLAARPSRIPFYSTVTGALQQGHGCDAAYWLDNLRGEVRFSAAVQALVGDGYATFLELGPHPSLSLPLTQVLSHAGTPGTVLGSLARQKDDHQVMYRSLALLYAQGADIDWKAVYAQGGRPADLPAYPFRRESYWLERTSAAPGPAGEPAYPFPGKKIAYPGQGDTRSFQLSLPAVPGEDREDGIAPGAGPGILLEMVLSALRQVWAGEGVVLRKVVFHGVPGADPGESLLQVDLAPAGEGFRFRLHGLRPAEEQWVEYATGLAGRRAPGAGDDAAGADAEAGDALPVGPDATPGGETPRGCLPPRLLQRVLEAAIPAVGRPATLLSCGEVEYLRPLGAACRYRVEDLTPYGTGYRMTLVLFTPQHERAAVLKDLYCALTPGAGDEAPLARLLYQPAWREAPLEDGQETGEASPWLVFEDEGDLGGKIAGFLAARGLPCVRVAAGTGYEVLSGTRYRIDPARPAHYRRLLADLAELGCRAAKVLHLWSFSVPCDPQAPAGELDRALLLGTGSVLHLLQALKQADGERPDRLVVVTRGAQAVDDGPLHAALAPVWGIGRVLRAENPDWHSQLIDCSPTDDCFDCLVAELMAPGQGSEIAYRGGRRYVSHLAPLPVRVPDPGRAVRPDPAKSYLVTGGFGALGLATAHWLVDHGAVHLALLGRSGGEHASRELARLRGRGARVQVLALDIADGPALAQALRTLHHPLGGIVHAAGVADNARLEEMDWDRFRKTLLPKVHGTWNLLQLTRQHPLDFFIAYSSVASLLGFKKLGSYAAANAFLDAAMQQRHRDGLPGLAVNWGPVEAGMTFDARYFRVRDLARIGLRPMPTEVMRNVLRTLWGGGPPQVLAADADWTVLRHGLAGEAPMLAHLSPAATQGPGRQPAGLSKPELAAYLQRLVKKVLEIKSLDYEKSLPQLGMDSLMAVEFLTDFRRQFNLSLSPAVFYHSSSFDDLTDRVYEQLAGEAAPALPDPKPTYS